MPNVWKIAPGRRAAYWDECRDGKFIAINWLNDIDLSDWTREEIKDELLRRDDGDYNSAQSIDRFVNSIYKDDIVVANRGLSRVVGIGIIRSAYLSPEDKRNPNRKEDCFTQLRRVRWLLTDEVDLGERVFNQPTVQPLNESQCAVVKRVYLKRFPKMRNLIAELLTARLSDDEAQQNQSNYVPSDEDHRRKVNRQIRERRGQKKFRDALRLRFQDRCPITNSAVLDVLEAAHIHPYRGEKENDPGNGLLLRSDIHTLFDLNLIGIEPQELKIVLHPTIGKTKDYRALAGKRLNCPSGQLPSKAALKERYQQFLDGIEGS